MKKYLLLSFSIFLNVLNAQVPNYVPTNDLIGWWPFNANAKSIYLLEIKMINHSISKKIILN